MPDRPTDNDPLTVELPLADVLAVLRLLDRAGVAFTHARRLEAAAAVRVDEAAAAALFHPGSSIAGMVPAVLSRDWTVAAEFTTTGGAMPRVLAEDPLSLEPSERDRPVLEDYAARLDADDAARVEPIRVKPAPGQ